VIHSEIKTTAQGSDRGYAVALVDVPRFPGR
jgi:hypothetical protein